MSVKVRGLLFGVCKFDLNSRMRIYVNMTIELHDSIRYYVRHISLSFQGVPYHQAIHRRYHFHGTRDMLRVFL